jgi:hypothetical protein
MSEIQRRTKKTVPVSKIELVQSHPKMRENPSATLKRFGGKNNPYAKTPHRIILVDGVAARNTPGFWRQNSKSDSYLAEPSGGPPGGSLPAAACRQRLSRQIRRGETKKTNPNPDTEPCSHGGPVTLLAQQ